jgi:hypothetical protein
MNELNQFVISRILGSTMKHTKRPSFGPLGLLHAQNQVLAQIPKIGEQITFGPQAEKRIIRAFEEIRRGFAVDRVLADPILLAKFFRRCDDLDVAAPKYAIALRLLAFRKSPRKDRRIAKATAREPKRDYSSYSFAAEMALVQMKYRYGASVDDILAYPEIGNEFDTLAKRIYSGPTTLEYRLAALHIRKSRNCESDERSLFNSMKIDRAERAMKRHASLDKIDLDELGNADGIVGFVEEGRVQRFLYIAQTKNISESVRPFTKPETLNALGNSFCTPSLSSIYVYLYDIHGKFYNATQSLWTKKLIHEKSPIFNTPILLAA